MGRSHWQRAGAVIATGRALRPIAAREERGRGLRREGAEPVKALGAVIATGGASRPIAAREEGGGGAWDGLGTHQPPTWTPWDRSRDALAGGWVMLYRGATFDQGPKELVRKVHRASSQEGLISARR